MNSQATLTEANACPLPVIQFSPEGHVRWTNAAWQNLLGSTGDDWSLLVHADDRAVAELLSRHGGRMEELRLRVPSGEWRWFTVRSYATAQGIQIWAMDTDESHNQHEDVLKSLERERELNELKTRFISLVSHEFRTPLTVILSSTELVQHYGATWGPERRDTHLRKIHSAVAIMSALLDNVALYGRVESGRLEVAQQPVALGELAQDVMSENESALATGQNVLLDDQSKGKVIHSDPRLLRTMLSNVLSNAIRFSHEMTTVVLRIQVLPQEVVFVVEDQGIGILPDDLPRVWEQFQRGANSSGIPGAGLGLAIVARSLELLGGTATLLARPGGGTRAELHLPLGGATS